jgi:putative endonuclease
LVYFEKFNSIEEAIKMEKRLKRYNRQWKLDLIQKNNPSWKDLVEELQFA